MLALGPGWLSFEVVSGRKRRSAGCEHKRDNIFPIRLNAFYLGVEELRFVGCRFCQILGYPLCLDEILMRSLKAAFCGDRPLGTYLKF